MRTVNKLVQFSDRHLEQAALPQPPKSSDEATRRWGNLTKAGLYKQLFVEQFGLCAYTELNIQDFRSEQNSVKGAHIEHIEPKSSFPQRTFDYFNLVLSALDSEDLSKFHKEDRFGGHYKLSSFDPNLFLSPLRADVNHYFSYSSEDGEIFPDLNLEGNEQAKAEYTIGLLNLNASYLKNLRKNWLQELKTEIDKLIDDNAKDALKHMAEFELCPYDREYSPIHQTTSQLRKFHSASLQLFGCLGQQVLNENCPECI